MGRFTVASGTASIAIGADGLDNDRLGAQATGEQTTALGADAFAEGLNTTALGAGASAAGVQSTAVGAGAGASGVGALSFGAFSQARGNFSTALGFASFAPALQATAIGSAAQATGENATAIGRQALARADQATAIGNGATADFSASTAVGTGATTTAANQVTLGGTGSAVRIGDIEASTAAQSGPVDAVTVDANGVLGRQQVATAASVQNVRTSINALAAVSDAQFDALAGRVTTLEGQIEGAFDLANTIDRDAQRGIASIAAQANPHFPSAAGKTSYASNVATYRGEVGFSLGLMHRLEGDFAITAGVSHAGGNSTAVRAGIAGEF
nr:YadA-like family protein [Erythrobacter sp. JK5]